MDISLKSSWFTELDSHSNTDGLEHIMPELILLYTLCGAICKRGEHINGWGHSIGSVQILVNGTQHNFASFGTSKGTALATPRFSGPSFSTGTSRTLCAPLRFKFGHGQLLGKPRNRWCKNSLTLIGQVGIHKFSLPRERHERRFF